MAIEVEIKAHVAEPAAVAARLVELGWARSRSFEKHDRYFAPITGDRGADFRLRIDGDHASVTFKRKRLVSGGEINEEREFTISDSAAFLAFTERIGCSLEFEKHKRGRTFTQPEVPGLLVELVEVQRLGSFIELEVMLAHADEARAAAWHERMRALLGELGIEEARIEPKPYSRLLRELAR